MGLAILVALLWGMMPSRAALAGDPAAAGDPPAGDPHAAGDPPAGDPHAAGAPTHDPGEQFARGNRLYEEGRFAEAAAVFAELVGRGFESSSLYFNLGNALLKSGELGEAIVYYERARALDPRAGDIEANITHARSLVVDVMPEPESSAFLDALVQVKDSISAEESLLLAALLLWMGAGAVAIARLSRGRRRRAASAVALSCLVLLGLAGTLAAVKVSEAVGRQRAVLVVPEVAVRAGPGDTYSSRFRLHEGTTVVIERQASGWTEVELTPTLSGWVPSTALMTL